MKNYFRKPLRPRNFWSTALNNCCGYEIAEASVLTKLKVWPSQRSNFDSSCDHKVSEAILLTASAITAFCKQCSGHQLCFKNLRANNFNRNCNCDMFGAIFETQIAIRIFWSSALDGNCDREVFESLRWAAILIPRFSKQYFGNELRLRDLWGNALDRNCDYEISEAISRTLISITRCVRQYIGQQLQFWEFWENAFEQHLGLRDFCSITLAVITITRISKYYFTFKLRSRTFEAIILTATLITSCFASITRERSYDNNSFDEILWVIALGQSARSDAAAGPCKWVAACAIADAL